MIKLLRAGFMRYVKNKVFWLSVAVTVGLALFWGWNYGSGCSAMAEFVVFAVLLTWIIGREQGEGMFHNKILAGYTRTEIYISEMLSGCGACGLLFLIFAFIYAGFGYTGLGGYSMEGMSEVIVLEMFLGSLLANLVMAAILAVLACLISNRYAAVVICILFTIVMSVLSVQIRKPATTKKYRTETYTVTAADIDEDGSSCTPGTYERKVPNEAWVGEPVYTICVFLYNVMPTGQMEEYETAGGIWDDEDGVRSVLTLYDRLYISEEDEEDIHLNLVYALLTLPAVCLAGWLGFRRKEFL